MAFPDEPRDIFLDIFINDEWVDVKDYVLNGSTIMINRGSGSEDNTTPPTTLSMTLYNGDGRFTQDNPLSPYYPYLQQNTLIRYGMIHNGETYTRFVGEIGNWPLVVNEVADANFMSIQAAGIFRRWARSLPLESPLRRTISASDSLVAYWPMEDDGSNTQSLASGLAGKPVMQIKQPIDVAEYANFVGSRPIPDIGTGQVFGPVGAHTTTFGQYSLRFIMNTGTIANADTTMAAFGFAGGSVSRISILGTTTGDLRLRFYNFSNGIIATGTYSGTFNVNNGNVMVVVNLLNDGVDLDYTLNVITQGESTVASSSGTVASTNVGHAKNVTFGLFNNLEASIGHAAVFTTTPLNDLDIVQAFHAFVEERAGDRYTRICAENNVTARLIGDPALTPRMGYQPIGTIIDVLQECAEVDHSLLFETRDEFGVTFLTRNALYNQRDEVRLSPDIPVYGNSGQTNVVYVGRDYLNMIYPGAQFKIYVIATGVTSGTLFTVEDVQDNGTYLVTTFSPPGSGAPTTSHELAIHRSGELVIDVDDDNEVYAPLSPLRDDRFTANDVTVQRQGGSEYTVTQTMGPRSTQDPPDGIGRYNQSQTLNIFSDGELSQHATWLLAQGLNDDVRWPNVQVGFHVESWVSRQEELFAADIGHKLSIESLESIDVYDPSEQLVRGYAETYDGDKLHYVTFNGVSEELYHVLELDNAELDCRWAGNNTTLAETLSPTATGAVDVSTGDTIWTTSGGDFPLDVMIGGERVTLSDINGVPGGASFVGVGTSDTDTANNSLTPGMPAGVMPGDLVLIFTTLGTTQGSGFGVSVPTNWTYVVSQSIRTFHCFAREYDGIWTMPTLTSTGVSASANFMCQSAAFRGVNIAGIVSGGSRFPLGVVNPLLEDIPLTWNLDLVAGQSGVTIAMGWKFTSWASVLPVTDFTEIGELDTTTGDDAGQTWAYQIGTAMSGSGSFTITTPVDSTANYRYMVIFVPTAPQEFVISQRSVNGVVKSHEPGAAIDVAEPFYYGL